ncbi:Alpha/Beta hydrolase protein [Lineolata rhizophorae]|uniref:Alpha/Beta hydrolase protein n=1 Tax=Lineolata rhizophorae TaxID=578093 RepID=A0A6A6NSW3_9PEZI|nr:Alpha/Beta hydrolase protein [Lineolata rhizophorae]
MLFSYLFLGLWSILLHCTYCRPAGDAPPSSLGIKFVERDNSLPTLTLPYGTWRAAKYNHNADIYTFKNIRFGAPPIGDLRWVKPAQPSFEVEIQDGSYGPSCIQTSIQGVNVLGPGNNLPFGSDLNQFLAGLATPLFEGGSEDCLFLDLYVPGKAVRDPNNHKLPVVVWLYGGAYVLGSKDAFNPLPFYDGTGPVQQSDDNIIFITSNYRLGAYGFLAGTTMESEGVPNAGFWDQRAVFQWVQDHISLVGGDKTQVSAWGESAGAGSILHHLTAYGGTLDPLFKRAVLQSPAYQLMWDRHGAQEEVFNNFTEFAGCAGGGLGCLRAASSEALKEANEKLQEDAPLGSFAIGPATDGSFVRQMAILELASGNSWQGLESMIVSHVRDEAELFVDGHIQTDNEFSEFLKEVFPRYTAEAGINRAIEQFYPPLSGSNKYDTQATRVKDFVRDFSFTCNARILNEAYGSKTFKMQYSVTPGWHAMDLLPTFYNGYLDLDIFSDSVPFPVLLGFGGYAQAYQSYLTSHARFGNPNKSSKKINLPPAIAWPQTKFSDLDGEHVQNVLNAWDLGFSIVTDEQMPKSHCDFILQVAAAVTNAGGYAPSDAVVEQSIVDLSDDPSRNFD